MNLAEAKAKEVTVRNSLEDGLKEERQPAVILCRGMNLEKARRKVKALEREVFLVGEIE